MSHRSDPSEPTLSQQQEQNRNACSLALPK